MNRSVGSQEFFHYFVTKQEMSRLSSHTCMTFAPDASVSNLGDKLGYKFLILGITFRVQSLYQSSPIGLDKQSEIENYLEVKSMKN